MMREDNTLPNWAQRFLRLICPEELYEEIEGDLIERFSLKQKSKGRFIGTLYLITTVIRYVRPGIIFRNKLGTPYNFAILHNYLLTTRRLVQKDKVNAAFKVLGLTLALFSLLVISLYVFFQLSFDRYHEGYERIYRVNTQRLENGTVEQFGISPIAFGTILQEGFPEVESFARFDIGNGSHVRYQDKVVFGGVFAVDSTWFDVFTIPFIAGTHTSFKGNTVILTKTFAEKIFGKENPINKIVTINNGADLYEVVAVVEDIPNNSHIRVDGFTCIKRKKELTASQVISPPDFVDQATVLYIKFAKNASVSDFLNRFDKTLDQYISKKQREDMRFKVFLQPLKNIYLDPPMKYEFTRKGNSLYVYLFIVIGIFLLVVSSINFANLSLAGFIGRSREMGVRKALGSSRTQVLTAIALDTCLFCVLSFSLAFLLFYLFFQNIKETIEPQMAWSTVQSLPFLALSGGILLLMIFMSTSVPVFWFSTNTITNDLKGTQANPGKLHFNELLLTVQFFISSVCIMVTLTIGRQIEFIHNKNLGIDRNNLLVLTLADDFSVEKTKAFKHEIKSIPGVTHASNSSFRMGGGFWKDVYIVETEKEMKSVELYEVFSDDELFETLGMKVLAGRVFDADHGADSGAAFVINETAARELGLQQPVGTRILTHPEEPGKWEGTIVGVVNDINIAPLFQKVSPLVMRLPWQNSYPEIFIYVRISGEASPIIKSIQEKYQQLQPGYPLEIHFVDDFYNERYETENRAYSSLRFGTGCILAICALGVFSLSIYLSIRKVKEFGIRKVFGATSLQISWGHISHFLKIAMLSCVLALPLAYFGTKQWLDTFAYRVDQNPATVLYTLSASLLLVFLSAGYASIQAGRKNPVEALRSL